MCSVHISNFCRKNEKLPHQICDLGPPRGAVLCFFVFIVLWRSQANTVTTIFWCCSLELLFIVYIIPLQILIFWQCKAVARPGVNDYEISIYLTWCHVDLFYFQILFALMHAVLLPKLKTNYYSFSKKESTVTWFQLTVWVLSIIFV